jgi:hypothetical protein
MEAARMIVIGLCGAAGAGKNSVAEILCSRLSFRQVAFADPLYEAASAITGMSVDAMRDRNLKEREIGWLGKSPRRILQLLGTEFGRGCLGSDVWVRHLARRLEAIQDAGKNAVITDVRFPNEAAYIANRPGGAIWKVVRDGSAGLEADAVAHESERGLPDEYIDCVIRNYGTLDTLATTVVGDFSRQFQSFRTLLTK